MSKMLTDNREVTMNVIDLIKTRRTIKSFKPDLIDMGKIEAWLEAASYAPNHKMHEPWEIKIIGKETRAKLNHKIDFGGAPHLFAVLSKTGANKVERDENIMATSCFIQNFILAAQAEGVGAFWCSIGASAQGRIHLQATDEQEVVAVLALGYPAVVPEPKPRTSITSKITYLD